MSKRVVRMSLMTCFINSFISISENFVRIGFSIRVHIALFEVLNPYFSVIHGKVHLPLIVNRSKFI